MNDYQPILDQADAWYRGARERHPDRVPCTRGCRDCCLGLFDVTLADRDLLREGLAQASPEVRVDIRARADAIVREQGLGETLDGWSEREIDDACDAAGDVECPVLGPSGECRLYAHRPLACRLSGVPLVDVSGSVVYPDGCSKCTLKAAEAPRLDCTSLRRVERRLLRKRYPGRSGVTLFIAQALHA